MLSDSKHPNDFETQMYVENAENKSIENIIQDIKTSTGLRL